MKKIILLLLITFTLSCCNKDDDTPSNPVDQLPQATQIGANTFGCLLDGVVFKPGNVSNPLDAQYQLINGSFYFSLDAARRYDNSNYISIGLGTLNLELFQGNIYPLLEQEDGKANGSFFYNTSITYTSINKTGELKITKLDQVNNIISGTFWFDIIDSQGVFHQIRDGRFDVQYTN
ncbi:hypothetical protein LXD69_00470 [Flavobacterium sediminilitoris]|uniref:Lipoprotein n=1 Tax=Flavobacterium sediminilitoris TaxID=2024526 RepID=A0ABY4HMB5_9FLAO|nr:MULTISPECIES: hypothetical protein [Flavobacterium]UOX34004.1 hypothetical protein LXD69_00470 [Flavobacterium sediminilitoris]